MKATVPYIEAKFAEFNQRYFGSELSPVPVELSKAASYVGQCTFKTKKLAGITIRRYDLRIRISTRHDLPEQEVEDTIIHEMIHCYIWQKGLRDTSTHGKVFREIMNRINSLYGRHITVSHRLTREQREEGLDKRPKWHLIALVSFADGRQGIKLLPRIPARVSAYDRVLKRSGNASAIEYYLEKNAWFNRFPTSSAYNVFYADIQEVRSHLSSAPIPLAQLLRSL